MLRASERALAHAKAWHVPLWVGEWTLFNRTIALPPPWNWRAQARTALTFFRKNGVGWALWLYGPGQFSRAGLVNRPKRNVLYVLRHYGY
jgi:hypothetical protein